MDEFEDNSFKCLILLLFSSIQTLRIMDFYDDSIRNYMGVEGIIHFPLLYVGVILTFIAGLFLSKKFVFSLCFYIISLVLSGLVDMIVLIDEEFLWGFRITNVPLGAWLYYIFFMMLIVFSCIHCSSNGKKLKLFIHQKIIPILNTKKTDKKSLIAFKVKLGLMVFLIVLSFAALLTRYENVVYKRGMNLDTYLFVFLFCVIFSVCFWLLLWRILQKKVDVKS